jgi:hypothetical protein
MGFSGRATSLYVNNYMYGPSTGSLNISGADANITICAWLYGENPPSLNERTIVGKASSEDMQYALFSQSRAEYGGIKFGIALRDYADTTTTRYYTTLDNYSPTALHHVAAVYNGTDVRIYVNGVLANTPEARTSGIASGTATFRLGTSEVANTWLSGDYVDEPIVFNDARTAEQIVDIYTNGIDGTRGRRD